MHFQRKIVVTGGAGFIGSHLLRALLHSGYRVAVLDNYATGTPSNLPSCPGLDVVEGSILDSEAVSRALAGASAVFHLAAIPSVGRSVREPVTTHEVNATGTLKLLESCHALGISRFVYAASSSAQGDLGDRPRSESILGKPRSPYGVAKFMGELYGEVYHRLHGMEVVSLRYFNVYGPRQRLRGEYSSVIPRLLEAATSDTEMTIFGDGLQSRDFTFIDDVVRACVLALTSQVAPGYTINVCSGHATTVLKLVDVVSELINRPIRIRFAPARPGDIYRVLGDPQLAAELLSFRATASIRSGLRATLAWFKAYYGYLVEGSAVVKV